MSVESQGGVKLNNREVATILRALRERQIRITADVIDLDLQGQNLELFHDHTPLDRDEITELCNHIRNEVTT